MDGRNKFEISIYHPVGPTLPMTSVVIPLFDLKELGLMCRSQAQYCTHRPKNNELFQ